MSRLIKALVWFVVLFHFAVFVAEAFLWMTPAIYEPALGRLGVPAAVDLHEQALTLRALFLNQGFYNLFLSGSGLVGLIVTQRGNPIAGHTLVRYACISALGAGIVLGASTAAYVGAFLQAFPSGLVLLLMRRLRADAAGVRPIAAAS
jgi:uncharacterized membrane protein